MKVDLGVNHLFTPVARLVNFPTGSTVAYVTVVTMSMSKTFIGGAVCREFESEAPTSDYSGVG